MNRIAILEGYTAPFGAHRRRRRRPLREYRVNPNSPTERKKWFGKKWKVSKSKAAVRARSRLAKCSKKCSRRKSGKFTNCIKLCARTKRRVKRR